MRDICFDTLEMLIRFVYTGTLHMEKCTTRKALELADYLMIDCAIKSLNDHISKNITKDNCLEFYGAFEILRDDVRDQLEVFIRKNLSELYKNKEFSSLNFDQLKSILSNPSPAANLADINGIIHWTTENNGYQYLPQLLPFVVFTRKPIVRYL